MKKIYLLIIALTLLISCSSDNDSAVPPSKTILLKRFANSKPDGTTTFSAEIEYDKTRMTKMKSIDGTSINEYIYTNNVLTNIKSFWQNSLDHELLIDYNQDGKISKNAIWQRNEAIWTNDITYPSENTFVETSIIKGSTREPTVITYTLQNRNIIKAERIVTLPEGDLHTETIYEYDTKNAPKKNVDLANTFQIIRFDNDYEYGNNNPVKISTYENDVLVYEYTNQYTYDSNNYPITKKRFLNGEWIETINYYYE